jgi:hypothetical protein
MGMGTNAGQDYSWGGSANYGGNPAASWGMKSQCPTVCPLECTQNQETCECNCDMQGNSRIWERENLEPHPMTDRIYMTGPVGGVGNLISGFLRLVVPPFICIALLVGICTLCKMMNPGDRERRRRR